MLWGLIGILGGIIIGLIFKVSIAVAYIKYTAVIIVCIVDSLFGATKEELAKNQFDAPLFVTGLFTNIFLALLITLLGEKLGLDLYLAVTVVFTFRIFSNVGIIRRAILNKLEKKTRR